MAYAYEVALDKSSTSFLTNAGHDMDSTTEGFVTTAKLGKMQ